VYRELGKGTLFVTEHIIDSSRSPEDVLFRILLYRMFNEIPSYRALRPVISNYNATEASAILLRRQENGHHVFRNAWLTAGTGLHGPGSKVREYCSVAEGVYRDKKSFYKKIMKTKNIREGWEAIKSIKWMGGFMGYQVALDYSYLKWIDWDEEDGWVYVGPGAKKGIYWLLGEKPLTDRDLKELELDRKEPLDYEQYIRELTQNQNRYFKRFRLKFRKWKDKDLDVHNMEFSLCEFNKLMRAQHGGRRKRYVYEQH
jgi:hypothetical protein